MVCVAGGIICFLLAQWVSGMEDIGKQGYLERNSYGEGEAEYHLMVDGLLEKPIPMTVKLEERQYGEREASAVFEAVMSDMGTLIAGDNPGLMEVRSDLNLITSLPESGVKLRWTSSDVELLDSFGCIRADEIPETGVSVWLTVSLKAGEYEEAYEIEVRLFPPVLTEEEAAAEGLNKMVSRLEASGREEAVFWLPQESDGKKLQYREQTDSHNEILLVLGVVLAVLCYARDCQAVERQKKQRSMELMEDYAEIVFKLMVWIGAGMAVLSAWECLVLDYETRRKQGRAKKRAGYEEMYLTYQQVQSGVPEGQAYIEFGKRCQLQPYLKLSSLLEQNRKTGTKNLRVLLETEMTDAWEQRKNMARRMGEEAGTKLLVPLFLMLGIVMVVIMVPAMLSMA